MVYNRTTQDNFVFDLPLYHKVNKEDYEQLARSFSKQDEEIQIEGYNSIKNARSTFYLRKGLGDILVCDSYHYGDVDDLEYEFNQAYYDQVGVKTIRLICKRYGDEITLLVFHNPNDSILMKVGQYPSVADIHIGRIKQYNSVLDKSLIKEFTRAIGLAANGVGIGSFAYLRRIFEKLIMDAFNIAEGNGLDEDSFYGLHMDEKIRSLQDFLPSFIVENYSIYGILSKGIHELSEEECLEYFDILRKSIELILDQRVEMQEKQRKQEEIKRQLKDIASKHKK